MIIIYFRHPNCVHNMRHAGSTIDSSICLLNVNTSRARSPTVLNLALHKAASTGDYIDVSEKLILVDIVILQTILGGGKSLVYKRQAAANKVRNTWTFDHFHKAIA